MKQCMWVSCGWFYDEPAGDAASGQPAGTAWADIPENWTCPAYCADKSEFEMAEI
jgi:rubredoxin